MKDDPHTIFPPMMALCPNRRLTVPIKIIHALNKAFHKYLYHADPPLSQAKESTTTKTPGGDESSDDGMWKRRMLSRKEMSIVNKVPKKKQGSKYEFEIIVYHTNVIRYFVCRALQLPPEAWLRLCTFNCSLTYI